MPAVPVKRKILSPPENSSTTARFSGPLLVIYNDQINLSFRFLSSAEYFKEVNVSALKLEAAYFSETSVDFYQNTHIVCQKRQFSILPVAKTTKAACSKFYSPQTARPHTPKYKNLQIIILKFLVVLMNFQTTYTR
jgi:hypothetical protein